ncbi:MbcA/ParS/Xre antitoxin family protein [Erythrobacter sp.]|uniref:MbcA/ParS/Xre antitoxin family protein n=1 Tax=Erythrobacter sp. TaxID=1042 RepID=UPI003459F2B3
MALFGGSNRSARSWLLARNLDFNARPIDLIDSPEGLRAVCDYLEGYRVRA